MRRNGGANSGAHILRTTGGVRFGPSGLQTFGERSAWQIFLVLMVVRQKGTERNKCRKIGQSEVEGKPGSKTLRFLVRFTNKITGGIIERKVGRAETDGFRKREKYSADESKLFLQRTKRYFALCTIAEHLFPACVKRWWNVALVKQRQRQNVRRSKRAATSQA